MFRLRRSDGVLDLADVAPVNTVTLLFPSGAFPPKASTSVNAERQRQGRIQVCNTTSDDEPHMANRRSKRPSNTAI